MNIFKIYIIFVIGIFICKNVCADNTFVFCSTENKKWEWLKVNNNYVMVTGEWGYIRTETINNSFYDALYFKVHEGSKKIEEFKNHCKNTFGSLYVFAQAASSSISEWYLLGIDDKHISGRFFEIKYKCEFCPFRNRTIYHPFKFVNNFTDLKLFITNFSNAKGN